MAQFLNKGDHIFIPFHKDGNNMIGNYGSVRIYLSIETAMKNYGKDAENYVTKRTCLWLKSLPALEPTFHGPKPDNAKIFGVMPSGKVRNWEDTFSRDGSVRSKTFPGIAEAMAEQWGDLK